MPTATVPAGLAVTKDRAGWLLIHTRTGKPVHPDRFRTKGDTVTAAGSVATAGIDWTGDGDTIRAAADAATRAGTNVRFMLLPPEERERRIRAHANSTRYLDALTADGVTVVDKQPHGPASVHVMSCGCHRVIAVPIMHYTATPEVDEDVIIRCPAHTDLVIPAASTNPDIIAADLRAARRKDRT